MNLLKKKYDKEKLFKFFAFDRFFNIIKNVILYIIINNYASNNKS